MELDDLDRRLQGAYGARAEQMEAGVSATPITVPPVEAVTGSARRASAFRSSVGATSGSARTPWLAAAAAASVLVAGVTAGAVARRGDDGDAESRSGLVAGGPGSTTSGTGPAGPVAGGPGWEPPTATGPDDPQPPLAEPAWWGLGPAAEQRHIERWSASVVDGPGLDVTARHVVELRPDGDWRSTPAASVVLLDQPMQGSLPNSAPDTIGGRAVLRSTPSPGLPGTIAQVVVDLGDGRSARVRATGLDEDVLAALVAAVATDGDRLRFASLPAGLTVMSASTVDGAPYHRTRLQYHRTDVPERELPTEIAVEAVDDPVDAAERTIDALAGDVSGGAASRTTVRDLPFLVNATGDGATWRMGGVLYRLWSAASFSGGPVEVVDLLRPLTSAELADLVIMRTTAPSWRYVQADEPVAPTDPDAERRIAAFLAAAPPGFERWTGDPPTPIAEGYAVRLRSDAADAWIDLQLVHSTVLAPEDTDVSVFRDLPGSRVLRWRSHSGWSYNLSVSNKDLAIAPAFDERAQRELLIAIDRA